MSAMTAMSGDARLVRAALPVVRIGVAFLWIQNVAWKNPPDFNPLRHFTQFAVDRPVFPPYAWLVEQLILPNFTFFAWLTVLIEAGLGAFLLVGLATRLWAAIGVGQSVVITLSALNAPNEWHWSYYLMILINLALFATAAGRGFGLDGVLRPAWQRSSGRVPRLLLRVS